MSRGVRDLRDLICVSRLSYRESDEEIFDSDEEHLSNDIDGLSLTSSGSDTPTTPLKSRPISPDSGILTNGSPTEQNVQRKGSKPGSKKKRRKKLNTFPVKHDLPKSSPLPPLTALLRESQSELSNATDSSNTKGNFDHMMCYMDASVVAGWLTRANVSVESLAKYFSSDDHFVQFAHFWLTEFPDIQKHEIYEMEFGILTEEINLAFAVGREDGQITHKDVLDLVSALFREYPGKLLSSKGSHLFLDYLDIMASERKEQYKKLLSDVRCSTRNRQYAQWLLAVRSFALVNVWTAITNFYRNLCDTRNINVKKSLPVPSSGCYKSVQQMRFHQAIRCGYVDVIHYMLVNNHVNSQYIDIHNRTWLFTAVMNNQLAIVKYLLNRVKPVIDVNVPSDTGNTALHAAANSGHIFLVSQLLNDPHIDINCINKQCDNSTPLHLAVMHGHTDVVDVLLKAGADTSLKMGGLSALDIARDFEHYDILNLLQA